MQKIRIENLRSAAEFIKALPDGYTPVRCDAKSVRLLRTVAFDYSRQASDLGLCAGTAVLIGTGDQPQTYLISVEPHERFDVDLSVQEAKENIRFRMEALAEGESMLVDCSPEMLSYVRHLAYTVLKNYAVTVSDNGCMVTRKFAEKSQREVIFALLDGYNGQQIEITDIAYSNARSYVSQYNKDRLTDFGVRKTEAGCVVFVTGELPSELCELYVTVRDKAPIDQGKAERLREYVERMLTELEALTHG